MAARKVDEPGEASKSSADDDDVVAALVRSANSVLDPSLSIDAQDWHFFTAASPAFAAAGKALRQQAKALLQRFPGWPRGTGDDPQSLATGLTSIVDVQLDRVDDALDRLDRLGAPQSALSLKRGSTRPASPRRRPAAAVAFKPQDLFPEAVDNHAPFVLPKPVGVPPELAGRVSTVDGAHPLGDLIREYPAQVWAQQPPGEPIPPRALRDTPCTMVDTAEGLARLASVLGQQRAIAVDLEAHTLRSFQGFTCLMQVSTRQEDFLVDVLALRGEVGPALGPVFHNPRIVKVLHGADSDVIWLQRDFGMYILGLFDTKQASELLGHAAHNLAHLLQLFCGVSSNKGYQLADWRVRPLSDGMAEYARGDTHYLLFIYDTMLRQLVATPPPVPSPDAEDKDIDPLMFPESPPQCGALPAAWTRSARVALSTYRNAPLAPDAHARISRKVGVPLSGRSKAVLQALCVWRDAVARSLDEGTGYIMPNRVMVRLADAAPETGVEVFESLRELSWVGGGAGTASAFQDATDVADQLAALIAHAKAEWDAAEEEKRLAMEQKARGKEERRSARHPSPTAAAATADAPRAPPAAEPQAEATERSKRRRLGVVVSDAPGQATSLGAALTDRQRPE
jgi:exosome complex exonuclease RRP6